MVVLATAACGDDDENCAEWSYHFEVEFEDGTVQAGTATSSVYPSGNSVCPDNSHLYGPMQSCSISNVTCTERATPVGDQV